MKKCDFYEITLGNLLKFIANAAARLNARNDKSLVKSDTGFLLNVQSQLALNNGYFNFYNQSINIDEVVENCISHFSDTPFAI